MTLDDFTSSLDGDSPPKAVSPALRALWWSGKGAWPHAHEIAQSREGDAAFDWVHAHLHRQEGDPTNAAYWYARAGRPVATGSLHDEWRDIAAALLSFDLVQDGSPEPMFSA